MRRLALLLALGSIAHADAPDDVRLQLADDFARKDTKAIARLVSDAYSGLRWCGGWDDATWKQTARVLREAKRTASSKHERVYEASGRRVVIDELNGAWLLDLNELLGPFPHR